MAYLGNHDALKDLISKTYDLAPKKAVFLDSVLTHPAVVARCEWGNSQYLDGYKDCMAQHAPHVDYWSVEVITTVGCHFLVVTNADPLFQYVNDNYNEFCQVSKPKPEKALQKMFNLRLKGLQKEFKNLIAEVNNDVAHAQRLLQDKSTPPWQLQEARKTMKICREKTEDCSFPSQTTRDELLEWANSHPMYEYDGKFRIAFIELRKVLVRTDMTDAVVQTGLDLLQAMEVMES